MFRGEFRFANGLILPNNITVAGVQTILDLAFRDTAVDFWVGLCSATYEPDLLIQDLVEPTIGTNGYARQQIARSALGWPGDGLANNEPYVESDSLIWAASGGAFDQAITRMFICFSETDLTGDVFALSASLPAELTIDEATLEADRTFKYRVFAR